MATPDHGPAAARMGQLIAGIAPDQLDLSTPCPDYALGDLLDHLSGMAIAFTAAAKKSSAGDIGSQGPSGDASRLGDDWQTRIPRDLAALAEAWRDPEAWTGMTRAGGVDLPGEIGGLVAMMELVIHAWDVARASGQPYEPDPASVQVVHDFVAQFSGPGHEDGRSVGFGPEVDVPADAPLFDRTLGMSGRDPAWSPS